MHSLKKKVVLTSIIVLFALIATIGSTFAWFTLDFASTVNEVQLEVGSDISLLIMMDEGYDYNDPDDKILLDNAANTKYVTNLTTTMIQAVYAYNNIKLSPVTTSADGLSFFKPRVLQPEYSTPAASASDDELNPGQYIEFSVWILSQVSNSNVAIRNLQTTASNSIIFKNVVANAVRMSIQNQANNVFIFGHDKDYTYSYRSDQFGYDSTLNSTYNSILPTLAEDLEDLHAVYFITPGTPVPGVSASPVTAATTVVSLTANVPQKLTIRIWVEGWDKDANNNIMSATLSVKFDFAVQL